MIENDYNKFSMLDFNRIIQQNHVDKIKKSILANGFISSFPILVNKDFKIIDGQHRFIACKQLGLPILYEIIDCDNNQLVIDLNTSHKNWTISDYAKFYADTEQNQNYIRLMTASKSLNVNLSDLWTLASKPLGGNFTDDVKNGTLIFTDKDVEVATHNLIFVRQVIKNLRFPQACKLTRAILALDKFSNYSRNRLLEQTKNYSTMAYKCQSHIDYRNMLIELYNYNAKSKKNIIKVEDIKK